MNANGSGSAINPTVIPALMSGGIWIPSLGVSSGGGNYTWASQATQSNTLTTANSLEKPTLTTASNGVAVWDMDPSVYAQGFTLDAAGSALKFASNGSYAFWAKETTDDSTLRYMLDMWPGGTTNRLYIYHNNTAGKMSINGSPNGAATDVPPERWKANIVGINFAQWNFFRFTFDYTLTNYTVSGGNYSNRMKVYINETLITEVNSGGAYHEGYSAPPPPDSSPPSGPVFGTGLYTGASTYLAIGANYASSGWKGQWGPTYAAYGNTGLNDSVWRRIMRYQAPR